VAADLPDSTYAVLGLIDKVPRCSGYDLVALAGRSLAHFWPISQTLLYRELDRLTGLGWVAATQVDQVRAPRKWTYEITDDGRAALASWLATPSQDAGTFRSPVLLRFFFAHRMPPHQVRSLLTAYRGALQTQHDELAAIVDKLAAASTPEARSGRLTALHGLHTTAAKLMWVDDVEAQLAQEHPG
jgi:DNA-binding PadR family transcriptional regulator